MKTLYQQRVFSLLVFLASSFASTSVLAGYNFVLSTSDIAPNAGNNVVLNNIGDTGNLYVWVSTGSGQRLDGVSLDIGATAPGVIEATSHLHVDPFSFRWAGVNNGGLNPNPSLLVETTNAFTVPGFFGDGIATGNDATFVLHSQLEFAATAAGTTLVTLDEGAFQILDGSDVVGPSGTNEVTFGSATVTAVPEPGSLALLIISGGALCLNRRRRSC